MPYLFKPRPPLCANEGCTLTGTHVVRSELLREMAPEERAPLMLPRCLRCARRLYDHFDALEQGQIEQEGEG